MAAYILPFEKPLLEIQSKIDELRQFAREKGVTESQDVAQLEKQLADTRRDIYANLTPWQKVMVARHPRRPYARDYINATVKNFSEIHGDRLLADDQSIIGGLGWIDNERVMIIGTQKGRDTKSNLACNFGCPFPEGYRKALRLMRLAAKFGIPMVEVVGGGDISKEAYTDIVDGVLVNSDFLNGLRVADAKKKIIK